MTNQQLTELYRTFFAEAPFVRVVDRLPATKHTSHTNFLDVALRVVRDRILVLVCEDNLVRGASGVAVQNFNRMYAFDEKTALL
jgi:N-acetyl-gamma-glutamyl-phosphate reductase